MATTCRGVRSSSTTGAGGSSSSDDTRQSRVSVPPRSTRMDTRASAIDCEPPSASGHPTRWPSSAEQQSVAGRDRCLQRQHRVAGQTGEQGAGHVALEARPRQARRGADARPAVPAQPDRSHRGERERRQQRTHERQPGPLQWLHQAAVGPCVRSDEAGSRRVDRAFEHGGAAVVKGMAERRVRVDPVHPVLLERQGPPRGRGERQWMDGRAHVVHETRLRELLGPGAAARSVRRLDDEHAPAVGGERDRGGEPVGAGPHHDGVVRLVAHGSSLTAE